MQAPNEFLMYFFELVPEPHNWRFWKEMSERGTDFNLATSIEVHDSIYGLFTDQDVLLSPEKHQQRVT